MFTRVFSFSLRGLLLALLLGAGVLSTAQAQDMRVGYTNHELLIANMPAYQDIQQQLQQEYQTKLQELQQMQQGLQERVERYQRQQALLSEESRQQREQEIMEMQRELQDANAQSEQELAQREGELLSPLFQEVDEAIKAVSKQRGLDLVLRSDLGPTQPIILYVNEETVVDITPDVARRLGIIEEVREDDTTDTVSSN